MTDYVTQEDDLRTYSTHTDGQEIRKTFGIPPLWKVEDQLADYEHPLPDCLIHNRDGEEWGHPGGTNCFAVGSKGSGKTTLALWMAAHLMDRNGETVIWRGSQARSEWLPFKRWTHLYLPAGLEVNARWKPEHNGLDTSEEPAELEQVVREVRRYDGLRDLLEQLEPHQFAVVYPDPLFRGCTEVMRESTYSQKPVEYVTEDAAAEPAEVTPLVHWWIALAVARVEGVGGHYDWTALVFDEVADLLPEDARADASQTYEKLEAMRRVIADSRKYGFSLFAFGHKEKHVHHKIRSEFEWRVAMPDDNGNPCRRNNDSPPVGFSEIPMIKNFLRRKDAGYGICWKPANFTRFPWQNIPDWKADLGRVLRIGIEDVAESLPARGTGSKTETGDAGETEVADD